MRLRGSVVNIRGLGKKALARFPVIDAMFRRFVWSRVHFPEYEMWVLSQRNKGTFDVAVDVGSALGAYSWILNRVAREVYAFEPGPAHYSYLKRGLFFTNIHLFNCAVGGRCGVAQLYTPGDDTNGLHTATLSINNPVTRQSEIALTDVSEITLDSFFENRLTLGRSIDLIKIDVEGYELDVLKGAESTLLQYHPLIICEIEARHNSRYREVFNKLRSLGYECFVFRNARCERFVGVDIEVLQGDSGLRAKLEGKDDTYGGGYVNNFIFQHELSNVKVAE